MRRTTEVNDRFEGDCVEPPACSVIIPTRDRPDSVRETLDRLARLPDAPFEIIVIDNGSSSDDSTVRSRHPNVRWIDLGRNHAACARNIGAMAARGRILFMLDDDSWPAAGTIDRVVREMRERPAVGAIACRVRLADAPERHDAGGAPGTFFNCGAAIRRDAFIAAGGYPIDYDYYVEEYALSCELWRRGWRVDSMGDALVWHRRTNVNRDANRMLTYLVRNNVRLWNTYAPESRRSMAIDCDIERYARIAVKERASDGFASGLALAEAEKAARLRRRRPLSEDHFDALLGLSRLRQMLRERADKRTLRRVAIWRRGKGCEFIIDVTKSAGIRIECVYDSRFADVESPATWRGLPIHDAEFATDIKVDALLIGSLSPGVAEDTEKTLRSRFSGVEIINPAPWGDAPALRDSGAPPDQTRVA
ncbi:MAG TPA: glycosyltransferase [Phycisphaerae bacterium]|nr:glycosyltransferase [Phycisphaerae bacterium]